MSSPFHIAILNGSSSFSRWCCPRKINRDAQNRSHSALPQVRLCRQIFATLSHWSSQSAPHIPVTAPPKQQMNKRRERRLRSSQYSYNAKHLLEQNNFAWALRVYRQVRNEKYTLPPSSKVTTVRGKSTATGPLYCDTCLAIPAQSQ